MLPRGFWDGDRMRDALGSWHMGRVFYAYRTHPWHPRPLSQELIGNWLGLTQVQVGRIEKGRAPDEMSKLVAWARILSIPGDLLWFKMPHDDNDNWNAPRVATGRAIGDGQLVLLPIDAGENAAVADGQDRMPGAGETAPAAAGLVGRDEEMALLAALLGRVAGGRGGSVLIEGEPGIGKSALVGAAVAEAAGAGCQVFWGAGDELGQALPLLPFLDGLRVREPSANPRRGAIVGLLRGEVPAGRGTDVVAVLAEQLLALVTEQCAVRQAVLVVDDLQWADPASVALWGRLARLARQVPLLLIGMMRPVPQREDLVALRRAAGGAARLQLSALAGGAVAGLVAALAGGRPGARLLRLADGAAGNPLYLTELVAALARGSGLAVSETGTVELAGGSVPGSLSAAIADRLDFVAGPVREVLRAAALLGADFAVPDLAVVLGRGVTELIPAVDEARAAGVLAESGSRLGFRHPLIRAALYEEMPCGAGGLAPGRRAGAGGRGRARGPGRPAAAAVGGGPAARPGRHRQRTRRHR